MDEITTKSFKESIGALVSIYVEETEISKKRLIAQTELRRAALEDIKKRFEAKQGERFLFMITGSYEETFLYGMPGKNQSHTIRFQIAYTGFIAKGLFSWQLVGGSEVLPRYPLPVQDVYSLDFVTKERIFDKSTEMPELTHWNGKGPSWSLDDVVRSMLSVEEVKAVYPKNTVYPETKSIEIVLCIGNKEIVKYMNTADNLLHKAYDRYLFDTNEEDPAY